MRRPSGPIRVLSILIASAWLSIGIWGQVLNYRAKQKPRPLEIGKVGDGIYSAKGEWGSNVGFCTWGNEILVIDSKATKEATKKVIEKVGKIFVGPITRIVFTHSDPDSFNGREAYPSTAAVICSPRVKEDQSKDTIVYLESNTPADSYASWPRSDFAPAMTFEGRLNIRIGRDDVTLLHYGRGHTSGDTIVWFQADRVAFIGDLVFEGREPLIQDQKGGNSFGLVRTLSILLGLQPEIRKFIPSHGDPIGRDAVRQSLRSIEDVHEKVRAMFESGASLADVKKVFGVRETDQDTGIWAWPSLAVTVYRELGERDVR